MEDSLELDLIGYGTTGFKGRLVCHDLATQLAAAEKSI